MFKKIVIFSFCSFVAIGSVLGGSILQSAVKEVPIKGEENKYTNTIGTSINNPIVLAKVKGFDKVEEIQQAYINEHYPDYTIIAKALQVGIDEHCIQSIELQDEEGNRVEIFFDINDAHIDYIKKHRKSVYKIERKMKAQFE